MNGLNSTLQMSQLYGSYSQPASNTAPERSKMEANGMASKQVVGIDLPILFGLVILTAVLIYAF